MKRTCLLLFGLFMFIVSTTMTQGVSRTTDKQIDDIKNEIMQLRKELDSIKTTQSNSEFVQRDEIESIDEKYEKRIQLLENKIDAIPRSTAPTVLNPRMTAFTDFAARLDKKTVYAEDQETEISDRPFLRTLEQQMQLAAPAPQQAVSRAAPSLNPDISAIGDFRSTYTSLGRRKLELYLNELELQVASIVDPYARAEFLFSFGKDLGTGELGIELEVATLTSLSLPYDLQVTLGKFKPQFGKVNILHPHYFSFIDFPKTITNFFESEGMFMEGISASWLVPNPYDFYQELIVEVGRVGSEPNASFIQGDDNRLFYSGHLKNFYDLTENATLELGLSGLTGPNKFNYSTNIAGIDLTYKWKPLQFSTYKSFTWQSEALFSGVKKVNDADVIHSYGGYSYAEYQFERRWFIGVRYDFSEIPDIDGQNEQSGTLLFRFQPTEFQILALQYQYVAKNYDKNFSQIALRAIFGIGKHGAHAY